MDSPAIYPTFELGGVPYTVKFTLGSLRRMKQAGVDTSNWAKAFADVDVICLAAIMSFYLPSGDRITLTIDEFADAVPMSRLGELSQCLFGAVAKVAPTSAQVQAAPASSDQLLNGRAVEA